MSVPARPIPAEAPPTRHERAPTRRPTARPPASTLPHVSRRARRGSTRFWVTTATVVTISIVAVVSLSALLVQSSFREQQLRVRIGELAEEHGSLSLEVVRLSSPTRVAAWAREEGLVVAEAVEVLRVRGTR